MVPVEAQACGTPVVALARRRGLRNGQDGVTGVLVDDQSAQGFAAGLARARGLAFDPRRHPAPTPNGFRASAS